MARRGAGILLRGRTYWLDFTHEGQRHYARLGRGISAKAARDLAQVKRSAILTGAAGIGGPKRKDLTLEKAGAIFMTWAKANKRPRTVRTYQQCVNRLTQSFRTKRLSEISPFDLERYKRERIDEGVSVMVNRELACLRGLYNLCRA